MYRAGDPAFGQAPCGLRRAVVGVLDGHQRTAAGAWHQIRPLADASRSPALLRAGRRQLDQDRLLEAAEGMDGAAEAGPRNRPDRDPGELASRRAAADAVHQEI